MENSDALTGTCCPRSLERQFCCRIIAVIIHDYDPKIAGIVLCSQRVHSARNRVRFVARWHDRYNSRPGFECIVRRDIIIERVKPPESSAKKGENNPNDQRKTGQNDRKRRHAILCREIAFAARSGPQP